MPWLKDNYQRWFPSLTWQARPQIATVLRDVRPGARIADLGAGGREITPDTICVDFIPFPNTDVCGDVQRLPFKDGALDLVVGTGLLEHVEDERATLDEVARVLARGGLAHMEMPFLQQYHDDPIDCRRMTVDGLNRAMRRAGLEPVRSGVHIGPTVTLITLFTYYAALWLDGQNVVSKALSTAVFLFFSVVLWPLKFLDRFLVGKRAAHRLAYGIYCTARKL
jgi:SAM-dependent methyltransferase